MRKLCRETVWGIGPSHKDLPRLCLAEPHHKQTILSYGYETRGSVICCLGIGAADCARSEDGSGSGFVST